MTAAQLDHRIKKLERVKGNLLNNTNQNARH